MARLSNTNQRRLIIEELRKLTSHPTAEELYELVKRRLPSLSLGTVYRNLDMLAGCGEILKLESAGRQRRFDGNANPHCHLRCVSCGAVEDISLPGVELIQKELDKFLGGRICGVSIEFSGQCRLCAANMGMARRDDVRRSGGRRSPE
jgi:Fur family transcriptional regulator, ferric uptake regulator